MADESRPRPPATNCPVDCFFLPFLFPYILSSSLVLEALILAASLWFIASDIARLQVVPSIGFLFQIGSFGGGETAEVWPISALTPISRLSYAAQNINQVKEQQQQQRQQQQHQQQQQQKYAVGRAWAGGRTRTDVMAANGNGPIQSVKWIQFNVMPLEWSLLSPGFNEPGMSDMGPTCFGFFHHRLRLYAIYWQLFKYLITWRDAAGATAATATATAAWNC